jgi:selenocysteine lyase/cysteine desulfurase
MMHFVFLAISPALIIAGALSEAAPPALGRATLSLFDLDPEYINVNQGSYGSTPTPVRQATEALVRQTERNPDLWFRGGLNLSAPDGESTYTGELTATRARIAQYLGTKKEDTVIVDNASHGINAILRSVPALLTHKGILHLDLAYFEVKRAAAFLVPRGHTIHEVNTTSLGTHFEDTAALVKLLKHALTAAAANGTNVGMCIFSHIVSVPAIVMPVEALAKECRASGALTLIDGAHVPGNLGPQVLQSIAAETGGVDFWVGNGE